MTESTFTFISQVFFVADGPNATSKKQQKSLPSASRSHAARVAHERRRAAKAAKLGAKIEAEKAVAKKHGANLLPNARFADIPTSIKIFWKLIVPGVTPMSTLFNTRVVTNDQWMPYMAQDVFFHAGAAAMHAAHDALVNPDFRRHPSPIIYEHRGKAMAALRQHMMRPDGITDAMLMAVCFLALIERRFDEMEAHGIHKKMLGDLVIARGGLDALSPYLKSVLLQYEFPWAMESGYSVLPRQQRRQPYYPPVHLAQILLRQIGHLPEGFLTLALQGKLSGHILSILERFSDHPPGSDSLKQRTKEHLVATKSWDVKHIFDDFWDTFPLLSVDDDGEPSLETLLFLGLIVYAGIAYSPIPQVNNLALCMRVSLKAKLLSCERIRDTATEESLCWIWTVAVSGWKKPDGSLDQPGCELLARQRTRFGYLEREEEYEKVLRKFFWQDSFTKACRQLYQQDRIVEVFDVVTQT